MNLAEVLDALRVQYKLPETAYPDDFLTALITKAIRKISEYYPVKELTFLNTVPEQTRYVLDPLLHPSLLKLTAVYYDVNGRMYTFFTDNDIKVNAYANFMSTFSASQQFELIQRLETMKKLNPSGADIVSHDTFDLIPTPTSDDIKVYYEYARYRTIGEIPYLFEEDIHGLVMFYLGEDQAQKMMANIPDGTNRYTFERRGNISTDPKPTMNELQNSRNLALDRILKNIQRKIMSLG